MEKQDKISKEIERLTKQFKEVEKDRRVLADKLIKEVAFMTVTIEDLHEIVNRDGTIITGRSGNGFTTTSEHPAQKSYNTMIKNYLAAMKQLSELTDNKTEGVEKAGEALKEFIRAGKK